MIPEFSGSGLRITPVFLPLINPFPLRTTFFFRVFWDISESSRKTDSSGITRLMILAKIINRVIPEESVFLEDSEISQKTLKKNVVLNGKGLMSGRNTGVILSPLPENSGIIFRTLDGISIQGNITSLENYEHAVATHTFTANSTVLAKTVELAVKVWVATACS